MSATTSPSTSFRKPLSWPMTTLICTNVVLLVLVGGAWAYFGSIPRALAYASGERLLVDSKTKSFGTVDAGAQPIVVFRLTNMSDRTINLIGSNSSCACVLARALPTSIARNQDLELQVSVDTSRKSNDISQVVTLRTDQIDASFVKLRVVGHVNEPAAAAGEGKRP